MFFKDTSDFKKYVPGLSASFDFAQLTIVLNGVDRNVFKKYLGEDFVSEIQTLFNAALSADALSEPVKELVERMRVCSANYAMAKWITPGQVQFSTSGVHITSTETNKTPFQWQIKDIKDDFTDQSYNALEDVLEYLEEKIDDFEFETYKESDEFKQNNYLFIPSAKEFSKHFSLFSSSRINFLKIISVIKTIEDFDIKASILPDYFNDLKAKLQAGEALGNLAIDVLEMIRPALANLVVAKGINTLSVSLNQEGFLVFDNTGGRQTIDSKKQAPDTNLARIAKTAETDGRNYLKILKQYLETHKDDYPLFKNDALYVLPEDETETNDGTKPFYSGIL